MNTYERDSKEAAELVISLAALYEILNGKLSALILKIQGKPLTRREAGVLTKTVAAISANMSLITDAAVPELVAQSYKAGKLRASLELKGDMSALKAITEAPGFQATSRDAEVIKILIDNATGTYREANRIVGRRFDDVIRKLQLKSMATQMANGTSEVQTALDFRRKLVRDGLVSGQGDVRFIRLSGRNYRLDKYSEMVARTVSREAYTHGKIQHALKYDFDVVQISSHGTVCDVCKQYEGRMFSLTGKTAGYPVLDARPPFHPNCQHVLTIVTRPPAA